MYTCTVCFSVICLYAGGKLKLFTRMENTLMNITVHYCLLSSSQEPSKCLFKAKFLTNFQYVSYLFSDDKMKSEE